MALIWSKSWDRLKYTRDINDYGPRYGIALPENVLELLPGPAHPQRIFWDLLLAYTWLCPACRSVMSITADSRALQIPRALSTLFADLHSNGWQASLDMYRFVSVLMDIVTLTFSRPQLQTKLLTQKGVLTRYSLLPVYAERRRTDPLVQRT